MPVRVTAEAEEQIAAIHAWWQENRPAAPNLFAEELSNAFDGSRACPELADDDAR